MKKQRRKKEKKSWLNGCSMFKSTKERKKEANEGIDVNNELVMNRNIKRKEEKKKIKEEEWKGGYAAMLCVVDSYRE